MNAKNIVKIIIIAFSAIIVILVSMKVYSMFTDNKADLKEISTGKVSITIEEKTPFDEESPEKGYDTTEKTFNVKSQSDIPSYIRIMLFPSIEMYDAETGSWVVLADIPVQEIKYNISSDTLEKWAFSDDGYYYCKNIVAPGEKTPEFHATNIKIDSIPVEYKNADIRINMYVQAEAIQASRDAYKINWNIDSLPEGVEILSSYNDEAEINS